jgi:hypothetical protein
MRTISKPTNEQLQRLMNLIALPAVIDEESIGDRFYFKDASGSYFISDYTKWLKQKYPAVYKKASTDGDIDSIEYGFWWRIDGTDGDAGFEPFKKCAEYIYTHESALEGVCNELKEYLDDFDNGYKEEMGIDEERWSRDFNPFESEEDYRSELAAFFNDVDYNADVQDVSKQESKSLESTIINFNAPDAKPGRKAPEIDDYEFTKKVLDLVKFNANDLPTASQFTRSNRMIGIPKSLLRDFKTKIEDAFVRQNPALKKVYADISKVDVPCENTEGSWVICVDVAIDDFGYITMMCGSGERNHSTTLPVVFFIYWDGSDWRAFVPVKGNAINMKTRKPISLDVLCHIDTVEDKQYLEGIGFDWEQSFKDWTPEWDVLRGQLYKRIIVENEE